VERNTYLTKALKAKLEFLKSGQFQKFDIQAKPRNVHANRRGLLRRF
jgi:hypothetical protein